jgi:peptidoglycan/xylan/chitin deacetylase (PgdA/CDA1 family)
MSEAPAAERAGVILLYHAAFAALPPQMALGLHNVDPAVLVAQFSWLKQHYDIVDIDTYLSLGDRRGKAAITFDDGYLSALKETLPILEALNLSAAFFLNGAMLEGWPFWRDQMRQMVARSQAGRFVASLPPVERERWQLSPELLFAASKGQHAESLGLIDRLRSFLAADGIASARYCASAAELPDSAQIVYGSHGYSHAVFASLSEDAARADIRRNRDVLNGLALNHARFTSVFAMPFGELGSYTDCTLRLLAEEGHARVLLIGGAGNHNATQRLIVPPSLVGLQTVLRGIG